MTETLLPNSDAVFQDDSAPIHTAGTVQSWFEEHECDQHFPYPAQSPDLNIIEPLCSVLETRVRNRFPPPTSLKQLADVLQEWYKIPLDFSRLVRVHFKHCSRTEGKRWSNTILIKKSVQYLWCFHYFVQPLYINFKLNCTLFSLILTSSQ
jgi:hypothetical protein